MSIIRRSRTFFSGDLSRIVARPYCEKFKAAHCSHSIMSPPPDTHSTHTHTKKHAPLSETRLHACELKYTLGLQDRTEGGTEGVVKRGDGGTSEAHRKRQTHLQNKVVLPPPWYDAVRTGDVDVEVQDAAIRGKRRATLVE